MCGIVGYLGKNEVLPILLDGLKRLEYRGYDSAGIAVLNGGVEHVKAVGKIKELEHKLTSINMPGQLGIAHTRWATHGQPSEMNAHPHTDCQEKIWLVHNGIIENYQALKKQLADKGHKFRSETDTEVIAHLIEDLYAGDLTLALQAALKQVKGAYGIVVFHRDEPDKLVAARNGSPLVLGVGSGETIIASDVSAILRYTNQVIYLQDSEIVELTGRGYRIFNGQEEEIDGIIEQIDWDIDMAEKQGYPHFMLKEIYEQPEAIANSIRGRLVLDEGKAKLGGLESIINITRFIEKAVIVACGTAKHAGLVGQLMLEEYAGLPTAVEYASEFRYRKPVLDQKTAVIAISQSGETADTLAAVREAREKGALSLGIVNVVGSTIARETEAGVYNHIGPEVSVASTKAFTSQIAILALFTLLFGRQRNISLVKGERIARDLQALPGKIRQVLESEPLIKDIAQKYYQAKHFMFLGRKYNYPTAIEGALKLKEISYIHAEGMPSGEMKHGAIAMIDKDFPSLFIAPTDSVYEKNLSNMAEIKARGGRIIAVTTAGNDTLRGIADDIIYIPATSEMLTPILATIPLQLFAYHMAILNGRDVDKPRNLAKSVTVE